MGLVAVGLAVGVVGPIPQAGAASKAIDACTGVPDSGPRFNFTAPCLTHDSCYLDRPYGDEVTARARCDREFFVAMAESCDDRYPASRNRRRSCKAVALLYYLGVRVLGGLAWDEARAPDLA